MPRRPAADTRKPVAFKLKMNKTKFASIMKMTSQADQTLIEVGRKEYYLQRAIDALSDEDYGTALQAMQLYSECRPYKQKNWFIIYEMNNEHLHLQITRYHRELCAVLRFRLIEAVEWNKPPTGAEIPQILIRMAYCFYLKSM